jgi:YD repeat-containing protein
LESFAKITRGTGIVVARADELRKVLLLLSVVCMTLFFAGPVSSGALLLLLPGPTWGVEHDLPPDYEPLHKGGASLATGMYSRENEDLIVRGTPALVLKRTYLSGYNKPLPFGIGTTHSGDIWIRGDGQRFQWAELIFDNGARVSFQRTSSGTSIANAMYEHRGGQPGWEGARLGWTGVHWALRRRNGALFVFQSCTGRRVCSVIRARDEDGHTTHYRRDGRRRLIAIESGDRWIKLEYDGRDRVTHARGSNGTEVRYEYEEGGRLRRVTSSDGSIRRYGYNDRNEMTTIEEPGASIENQFENGRCVRQINRFSDGRPPYVFDFTYEVKGERVVRTESRRSDGTWIRYLWNDRGAAVSESRGDGSQEAFSVTYERDAVSQVVTALTLICPDRRGQPLKHTSVVSDGNEDVIKEGLLQTHCFWRHYTSAGRAGDSGAEAQ